MKSQCALEGGTDQVENRARAGYRSFRVWKFVFRDYYILWHLYCTFILYTCEEIEIVFTMRYS